VGGGTEAQEIAYADENGNPIVDESGAFVKPLDFSITKVAFSVMIASLILLLILFGVKRSCIKNAGKAPKGMQSLMEILILFIRDGVVVPIIGEKHYQRYLPYILTLFLFIFLCNIIGLVPFFPGGVNVTGNIAITGVLAVITFLITTFSGNKHYWKDIFNTPGVPWWLKFPLPIMPLVEFVGMFTKPFVLMVRLFANITAGHIVTLGFIFLIFIFGNTMSAGVGYAVSPVSVIFSLFISALECLVAFIQAYVFAMLSSLYIGMAVHNPEEEHA
ncbi:MAG: F0F1 ATP synthase subunit A, partial [Bacteroidales bacterium]|nr:F0F1 ATP synthase subunit A [Bacteroidales bacterium]